MYVGLHSSRKVQAIGGFKGQTIYGTQLLVVAST
jgi:hypothetical protein